MEAINSRFPWLPACTAFSMNLLSTEVFANSTAASPRNWSERVPLRGAPGVESALLFLDLIPVAIYAVDLTGTCTLANRAFVELLGYESAKDLLGRNMHFLAHRSFSNAFAPGSDALTPDRAVDVADAILWRADETSVPVEYWSRPITEQGNVAGAVVTVLDITQRKGVEKEWRKLVSLIDSSEDLIGMASADRRVSFLNQGGAKLVGLEDSSQAMGREVTEFLTEAARETLTREAWPCVAGGGRWTGELQLASARGNVVDVLANAFLVRQPETGEVLGQATIMRDITERKNSERERHMLASLVESSSDFIGIASQDGRITFLNDGGCKLAGVESPAAAIGLHISAVHPEEAWAKLQAEVIPAAVRDGHWRGETQLRNLKTGEIVDVLLSAFMLQTPGEGSALSMGAVMHDISERKKAEQSLQQAKESAELANRMKSEFLANMSHEIRTPMNGIMGMTDLALDTELTAEQRDYLETVKESADSLLRVINDILDFSKIEAGKLDLDPSDFDLRETLGEIFKLMAPAAGQKGLHLRCAVDESVPAVLRADSVRLRQIIVNLVGNAIKFTKRGDVGLSVHAEFEGEDTIRLSMDVSDTGIGIPADKRRLIFEAFAQADGSMSRKFGGTGLGLTISAKLVQMMQGTIWVESVPGEGSTFHFTVRVKTAGRGRSKAARITEI